MQCTPGGYPDMATPAAHRVPPPSGTVTFLFTYIEGSTRLLGELGAQYAEVMAEQRQLLREAIRQGGGRAVARVGRHERWNVRLQGHNNALESGRELPVQQGEDRGPRPQRGRGQERGQRQTLASYRGCTRIPVEQSLIPQDYPRSSVLIRGMLLVL